MAVGLFPSIRKPTTTSIANCGSSCNSNKMSSSCVVSASSWTLHRRHHHHPPLKLTPLSSTQLPASPNGRVVPSLSFRARTALSLTTTSLVEEENAEEKFDWYSQWYPVMPLCDLDKRRPHAKRVIGLDLVVWWDRNEGEGAWKVFDDTCPHRLAPLSEGRIDRAGRLQCVYHGWCFDGSGDCKFIPQAPADGPPVHTSKRACVAAYPTTVQHDIVWFWANADPQYEDIISKKKPPYIPELDDPSFTKLSSTRDFPYGYEVLMENLMDPAHVPYTHHGLLRIPQPKDIIIFTVKADREGGRPLDMRIKELNKDGFLAKQDRGNSKFIAPCVFYAFSTLPGPGNESAPSDGNQNSAAATAKVKRVLLIFICVPVSPGHSRLIWSFPRNFGLWIDRAVPRWMFHVGQNLVLDSDLYLLHVEERKIEEVGSSNWQKACYVPTKSDALVVGFRRWLNKYAGGHVDWQGKYSGALPPTPPREQLLDRYWSHVVNCSSCSAAYKGLNALEVTLQVLSLVSVGILAATKQNTMSALSRSSLLMAVILFFAASKWLAYFVYKNFRYHDYDHAFR